MISNNTQPLMEFNWDIDFKFKEHLFTPLEINEEQRELISNLNCFVKRCKLQKQQLENKVIIDYIFPSVSKYAKCINKIVTSALFEQFILIAKNPKNEEQFTYYANNIGLPHWYITFGTKNDILTLTCEYSVGSITIA